MAVTAIAGGGGAVVVVVEGRYLSQAQPAGLVDALRHRGVAVRIVEADGHALRVGDDADWLDGADLVVVRGRSTPTLALAAWAEGAGVPTINARVATERVRNKAELAVALAQAGIPSPLTFLGSPRELAEEIGPEEYPVLLKPVFGDNSRGLMLVAGPRDMRRVHWPESVALAQRFMASDGRDLKLYAIGELVFAVRKPSPFPPDAIRAPDSVPVRVTPRLRELARRCGRLFGLELFGVDCIERPDGPLVIEVNEFPNYTGVPDADGLLADHVLARVADTTAGLAPQAVVS
jgi:ribosomal protein S6--L-glutamate ligase